MSPPKYAPGSNIRVDFAPLYDRYIDLSDKYDITILRSHAGVCISYRSTRLKALLNLYTQPRAYVRGGYP